MDRLGYEEKIGMKASKCDEFGDPGRGDVASDSRRRSAFFVSRPLSGQIS
jgi:hypothetical protein